MRVFYLEDYVPDVNLMRQYMDSAGHEFSSAGTLGDARLILEDQRPDVFLVDIIIQGEDAYDLIAHAVKTHLSKNIIAITAKAVPEERQRCLALGCSEVMFKPFTVDDLERVLASL